LINRIETLFAGGPIRRDALQIYVIQGISLGLGLAGSIIVARTLGPAKKGIFDLFSLLSSFILDFGLLGFGSGLLYYLANKGWPLCEVHGTGFVFSILAGIPTVLIGWLGLRFWVAIFPGLDVWVILLPFLLSTVTYYRLIWTNIMTGINRAVATYRIGFYFTVCNVTVIFSLWKLDWLDLDRIVALTVLLTLLNGIVAFFVLFRQEPRLRPSIPLARESLKYGLVIYVGFIANVLHFKVDQVMINYWLGTDAVGIYAVSARWAEVLFILDTAIISAALYKISSASAKESYALTRRLFKVQLLISSGSGILLGVLAYPLIFTLYGEPYSDAIWPLVLLIPGVVFWSAGKVLSQYLSYNRGKFWLPTLFSIFGVCINIILNFMLINKFGIGGAAVASTISYGCVILLTIIAYKRQVA